MRFWSMVCRPCSRCFADRFAVIGVGERAPNRQAAIRGVSVGNSIEFHCVSITKVHSMCVAVGHHRSR